MSPGAPVKFWSVRVAAAAILCAVLPVFHLATDAGDIAQASGQTGKWHTAPAPEAQTPGQAVRLDDGRIFRLASEHSDDGLRTDIFEPSYGQQGRWKPLQMPDSFDGENLGDAVFLRRASVPCGPGCVLVRGRHGKWAIYSPVAGWKSIQPPAIPDLTNPTLTALASEGPFCGINCGKVLLVGGNSSSRGPDGWAQQQQAQLYDPVRDVWLPTDSPLSPRINSAAVLLEEPGCGVRCGHVLIVGGGSGCLPGPNCAQATVTAEFFDPLSSTFSPAPVPQFPHGKDHTARLLKDGRVLVSDTPRSLYLLSVGNEDNHAEIFDPAARGGAGEWKATGNDCLVCQTEHSTSVMPDGRVLAVGERFDGDYETVDPIGAQVYDPGADRWLDLDPPSLSGVGQSSVLLWGSAAQCGRQCGKVLVVGLSISQMFAPVPQLEGVEPAKGSTRGGTHSVIRGSGLASALGATFGEASPVACGAGSAQRCYPDPEQPDSRLHVLSPPHREGPADLSVVTDGGSSNKIPFSFEAPPPLLRDVLPRCGPLNDEFPVTLTGDNLDVVDSVVAGGVPLQGTSNPAGTQMQVVIPAQASPKTLDISVASRGRSGGSVAVGVPCPPIPVVEAGGPPPSGERASGNAAGTGRPIVNTQAPTTSGPGSTSSGGLAPGPTGAPPGGFTGESPALAVQPLPPAVEPAIAQQGSPQLLGQSVTHLGPMHARSPLPGGVVGQAESPEAGPASRHAMIALGRTGTEEAFAWGSVMLAAGVACGCSAATRRQPRFRPGPALGAPVV